MVDLRKSFIEQPLKQTGCVQSKFNKAAMPLISPKNTNNSFHYSIHSSSPDNAIHHHHIFTPTMHFIIINTLFTTTTIIIIVISAGNVTASPSPSTCANRFTCGTTIQNLTFPFSGGDRPSHCGPPEYRLTCVNDEYAELIIDSLTYRVIQVDQTERTLTIARLDFWNTTCPIKFVNASLDLPTFDYSVNNEVLSLLYACSPLSGGGAKPYNWFACNVNVYSDAYYMVWPMVLDSVLKDVVKCGVLLSLPMLKSAAQRLVDNETSLSEALMQGFNVNYSVSYESECFRCLGSGGQCGFDSDLDQFACFCGNKICRVRGKSSSHALLIVGVLLGAAATIFIALVVLFFAIRQRKKKLVAESKSKGLRSTPSSDGLTTTKFSKTTRSYPSSLCTDVEKGSTYFGVQVFTFEELEEATDNFDSSRELGDGGFGVVYKGNLRDGRVVAVKRLYENNFKRVQQFINEVEIIARLRHQNLASLYGCTSRKSQELLLVYEYIPNGTVADHLHGNRASSGLLTWPVRLRIAIESACALTYLHKSEIIHRDVKTSNILLDNDCRVKVADFGLSRMFPTDVTHVSTAPQGTPGYVDPEYYQCYQLTAKSDVYSFGVVLMELITSLQAVDTNRHRHDINLSNMAISKIQNHKINELVDPSLGFETDCSVKRTTMLVAELAFRCLQQDRDMRPSMEEVVECLRAVEKGEAKRVKPEVVDFHSDDVEKHATSDFTGF